MDPMIHYQHQQSSSSSSSTARHNHHHHHHEQQQQEAVVTATAEGPQLVRPMAMKLARPQAVRPLQMHFIPNVDDDDDQEKEEDQQQQQEQQEQSSKQHKKHKKERRHHRKSKRRETSTEQQSQKEDPTAEDQQPESTTPSHQPSHSPFAPPAGLVRPTPMRMTVPSSSRATKTTTTTKEPMPPLPPLRVSKSNDNDHQYQHLQHHQQHQHKMGAVARTQRLFRNVQPFTRDHSEQFYHTAHAQQIAGPEVHQAIMESQDWHRKWTFQDEEDHTRPQQQQQVQQVQVQQQQQQVLLYDQQVYDQQQQRQQLHQLQQQQQYVPNHYQYAQHQAQYQPQQQQHHPMFLELLHREMDGAKNPSPQMSPGSSPPEEQQQQQMEPSPALITAKPTPLRPSATILRRPVAMNAATAAAATAMSTSASSYGSSSSRNKSNQYHHRHAPLYEDEEQILVAAAPTSLVLNNKNNRRTAKHYSSSRRRQDEEDQDEGMLQHHHHDSKRRATFRPEDSYHPRMMIEDDDDDEDDEADDLEHQQRNDPQLLFPVRPKVLRPVAMRVALPPPVRMEDNEYEQHQEEEEDDEDELELMQDVFPRNYNRRHSSQEWSQESSNILQPPHVPQHVVIDRSSPSSSPLSLPTVHSGGDFDAPTMTEDHHNTQLAVAGGGGVMQRPPEQVHFIEDDHEDGVLLGLPRPQPLVVQLEQQQQQARPTTPLPPALQACRDDILQALALSGGEVSDPKFLQALEPLAQHYAESHHDTRPHLLESESNRRVEGMWLSLSKPTFFGNLGENDQGDPMYTLGRMAFDMYAPAQLVCSLQGNFNPVSVVPPPTTSSSCHSTIQSGVSGMDHHHDDDDDATVNQRAIRETMPVPKKFQEEVASGSSVLRTYNVVSAMTVEPNLAAFPNAPNKDVRRPIKGIMTTFGYTLPDPEVSNRHSIWFTGGRMEPNNDPTDIHEWKRLFQRPEHQKRGWDEQAKLLAAKMLMGATVPTGMADDGSMEYTFTRPLGGHGVAYIDVIYLDDTLRIVRGHRGTVFVFARLPESSS